MRRMGQRKVAGGISTVLLACLCASIAVADDSAASRQLPQRRIDRPSHVQRTPKQTQLKNDALGPKADAARAATEQSMPAIENTTEMRPSSGLRAPGDNDLVLFDNMQGNTWSGDNEGGDDLVFPPAPLGTAYAIDEISVAVIRIASTTIPTWARIKIWHTYDLDIASNCPATLPVHYDLLGTVIVNLGVDDDSVCNTFDRLRINLNTGEVYDLFNDVVLLSNGIISNSSPTGWIPGGNGTTQIFVTVEFGQPNGTNTDIIDGPNDACDPSPGGRMMYSSDGQDVLVGNSNNGFYSDTFGNNNGAWDCDEFVAFGFTPHNGLQLGFGGSTGTDCDGNGLVDSWEILTNPVVDSGVGCVGVVGGNGVLDVCECADCNSNGIPDATDIFNATSTDCNEDFKPDECQIAGNDCNSNGALDVCDIAGGISQNCNGNLIPDECDTDPTDPDGDGLVWRDCDGDVIPDGCQFFFTDCNRNNIADQCDVLFKEMNDFNANGAPDVCEVLGRTVVLDFDETHPDFDYVAGQPVHDQPYPLTEVNADWLAFNDQGTGLALLPNAGYADVVSAPVMSSGKSLMLREVAQGTTPTDDWAVMSPHVYFADPDVETVTAFTPLYQEMSLKIRFNIANDLSQPADGKPDTNLDWDLYFGSLFDQTAESFIVNDSRVLVTFKSMTDSNGFPTEIWVAGDGGYIRTGIDWAQNLNTTHTLRVVIDLRNQPGQTVTNAAKVYWDGNLILTLTPGISVAGHYLMDKIYFDQFRNAEEIGFGGATMQVDDITLIRDREGLDCSLFLSDDCNGDGICDVYQLAIGDRDDDGTLDICEGFCEDCNNNSITDSAEIEAGTAPDANLNGIIDWCERTTHATSFEAADGWVVGPLHGQLGWRETDGGSSEITSTPVTGWPRNGARYLAVKKNPDTARDFAIIYAPRQDVLGDKNIEIWSWDWGYNASNFFQVAVELGDLCTDIRSNGVNNGDGSGDRTPAGSFDEAEWIDIANVGLALFANVPNATQAEVPKTRIAALQVATGVHGYLEISGVSSDVHASFFADRWNAAGIKVMNQRGEYDVLWAANNQSQTIMLGNQLNPFPTGSRLLRLNETRRPRPPRYPSSQPINEGGDRQMVIRVAARPATTVGETTFPPLPPFGDDGLTTFYFDDFRYTTGTDCDADGVIDANFIAGFPEYDANNDGILDNCQDCDDDCGPFPITPAQVACLDPNEAAVGPDCNNNGLQDSCDVNPNRPFINKVDTAGCYNDDDFLPNGECFEARAGGGSCDLNENGVPDECEGDDCNGNGCLDSAEIDEAGGSGGVGGPLDVDNNGVPDECQPDCNNNGNPDSPKTSPGTDLNLGNTGGPGSQDSWPYFGNPLQIGDGIPDECCVVCTGLPGGFPWNDQCSTVAANGDVDRDGDVDAYDYKFIQRCASDEPANPPNPFNHPRGTVVGSATGGVNWDGISCGCADLNGDGVVDGIDANLLQTVVTGPE